MSSNPPRKVHAQASSSAGFCVLLFALVSCDSHRHVVDARPGLDGLENTPGLSDDGGALRPGNGASLALEDAGISPLPDSDLEPDPDGGALSQTEDLDAGGGSEAGGAKSGRVAGRVVAIGWGYGAPGRKVVLGAQSTVTGSDGSFAFDDVSATYDVMVVEPDDSLVSVYYGLTRRDPILSHSGNYSSDLDTPPQMASVAGNLSGGFDFPVDAAHMVTIYYLADQGHNAIQVAKVLDSAGPAFGPMRVAWNGLASIIGTLVAVGQYGSAVNPWINAFLASQPLALANGSTASVNLQLAPVPSGHIGGNIKMYQGNSLEAVHFSYFLPRATGGIELGHCASVGAFDCELPDLSSLGGYYCAGSVDAYGYVQAEKCGVALGTKDVSIQIPSPPQLQKPADGSPVTRDSKFVWSSVPGAVYVLTVNPDLNVPNAMRVEAYTASSQLRWSDLEKGERKLANGVTYRCGVKGLLPYGSLDEFASSRGLFATGIDQQQLDSKEIHLTLIQ